MNIGFEVLSDRPIRVLISIGRYLPGTRDGGPVRSVANMISYLSPHITFYLVTRDRDVGDRDSYSGVKPDNWHTVGPAQVLYCSSVSFGILRRAYREARPDIIYLNGCWDAFSRMMLILHKLGIFGGTSMIIAPRGGFSSGAMKIKPRKKWLYMRWARLFGLYSNLFWHASTPRESHDLMEASPARNIDARSIHIAYTMSDATPSNEPHISKEAGSVKLVFIARICEMKNLHFLLNILRSIRGNVQLNLFGALADSDTVYWDNCREIIAQLPANIHIDYRGEVDHSLVPHVLHDHHFFVLPTQGENFCHAAVEALVNGTPVVISDETPWLNLAETYAGFDIALADRRKWADTLQMCVDMDQTEYTDYLLGALKYGLRFSKDEAVHQHLAMLSSAVSSVRIT